MSNVSGHSGLPEEIELEQMARRFEEQVAKTIHRYNTLLSTMDGLGIAPHERQKFLIQFMKWVVIENAHPFLQKKLNMKPKESEGNE